GPFEERIEIGKRTVKAHGKFRKVRFEPLHSAPPLLCEERSAAPAIGGFPGTAAITAGDQFPQDAPLEVGIAMVPVRNERVGEENEMHGFVPFRRLAHTTNPRFSSSCCASPKRSWARWVETHWISSCRPSSRRRPGLYSSSS